MSPRWAHDPELPLSALEAGSREHVSILQGRADSTIWGTKRTVKGGVSASVTSGTGMVTTFTGNGTPTITVNLTGVINIQRITMTLHSVNDGNHTGDVPVSMGVLIGDTTGNGLVNAGDVSQTKSQVGQPVGSSNFREDVNASGTITATDVAQVKANVGTSLPP